MTGRGRSAGASAPARAARRGRPRDERCDVAITAAALALLRERGFPGVTVEAVAARAGVGKATIYRRWPSREALVADVLRSVTSELAVVDTGDLRADLKRFARALARHLAEHLGGGLLPALVASAVADPEVRALLQRLAAERRTGPVALVRRAVARGELRPGTDPEVLVDLIAGPLFYRLLISGGSLSPRAVDRLVDTVLAGALADPPGARRRGRVR